MVDLGLQRLYRTSRSGESDNRWFDASVFVLSGPNFCCSCLTPMQRRRSQRRRMEE